MTKINLGCGENIKRGWLNLDKNAGNGIDIVHNLNNFPYPFESNTADFILLDNVLEHLNDPVAVIKECFRILNHAGTLRIKFPHHKNPVAWSDPTHKHAFTVESFKFLDLNASEKLYKNNPYGDIRFYKFAYKYDLSPVGRYFGQKLSAFLTHFVDFLIVAVEVDLSFKVYYHKDDFMRPLFYPSEYRRRRFC